MLVRHAVADPLCQVGFEPQIAIGDDAHQLTMLGNRHAGNPVAFHQIMRILQNVVRRQKDRVDNDAVFRPLHFVDFVGLTLDRHVLVNDAQTAFTRHRDRHAGLRHRIHAGTDDGDIQTNIACQECRNVDILG